MADELNTITQAVASIETRARAEGKASAERPALGLRAGAVVIRAQADACAGAAAGLVAVQPAANALKAAAAALRARADVLDPPGP